MVDKQHQENSQQLNFFSDVETKPKSDTQHKRPKSTATGK